jgi:hypothetical protein
VGSLTGGAAMSDWVDTWARQLAQRISRRQMLGGIGAVSAGGALGALGVLEPGVAAAGTLAPGGVTLGFRAATTVTCPTGYVPCGDICCDPDGTCTSGVCSNHCGGNAHFQTCNGVCQDVYYDPSNCGYCGHVCPPPPPNSKGKPTGTAVCDSGTCRCSCNPGLRECVDSAGRCHCVTGSCPCTSANCKSPNTCCGGVCTDPKTDLYNCGACGHVCECENGFTPACSDGTCVCQCLAPSVVCGTICTDLAIDVNNCGACGNVCASHCSPPPGFTTTCDAGQCANEELVVQFC